MIGKGRRVKWRVWHKGMVEDSRTAGWAWQVGLRVSLHDHLALQVIEFVCQEMEKTDDLGVIAAAVCDEALERGSKDNITCMVVQFISGTEKAQPAEEFRPGVTRYGRTSHGGA